jgi:fibronectin-binding autotransporter adhesin
MISFPHSANRARNLRRRIAALLAAGVIALATFTANRSAHATDITWTSSSGNAWLTAGNWDSNTVPGSGDTAIFATTAGDSIIGINMNGATNNGSNNQIVGAISLTGGEDKTIRNSSTTVNGTLTLAGNTVNGVSDVILRNSSTFSLTLADGTSKTMAVALGDTTNNIVLIESSGGITISSVISGTGKNLTLQGGGSGILTFSGGSANTYDGTTTINTGELDLSKTAGVNAIAGNLTIGDGSGTDTVKILADNQIADTSDVTVNSSGILNLNGKSETIDALISSSTTASVTLGAGTLTVGADNESSATFAGVISGTGSLSKSGTGTQTLSGANTYSGGTTLNAGTLQLGSSSTGNVTNGPVGTGTLTLNGGTLSSNVGDFITVRSIANAVTFGGDVTFGTNTNFGALTLSGAGTLTGTRTLTFVADVTYSGNIGESGGSFGIIKNGSGTLKLSGVNSYSGGTTVNQGLLWLNSSSALASTSGSLTVNGGIVDLAGNNTSVGNLTGSGGTIWNNLGPSNAVTLTIGTGNNGGGNYQGVIANNNGASSGTVALTKTGNGTITLSGANTYTGATTVNGGTLLINGSTAAGSAVTVNNTGTLGGTGTVSGMVDVKSGGTLSPGTSPGTLHTGALTLENGSTFVVDLTAASGNDLVVAPSVTLGTIVLGPSLSLNISGNLSIGQQFFIVNNTGANAVSGVFAQGATVTSGSYTFTIDYLANFDTNLAVGGNDIMLEVTAVPEVGTWAGGALAGLGLTQRRRFRRLLRKS